MILLVRDGEGGAPAVSRGGMPDGRLCCLGLGRCDKQQ